MSEEEATSDKYWLSSVKPGIPLFALCNMTTEDIDECTASHSVCHVNAQCTNTIGSYRCTCNPGYTGNGNRCTDIDECTASPPACHLYAQCTNTIGSYRCTCNPGYTSKGNRCTDFFYREYKWKKRKIWCSSEIHCSQKWTLSHPSVGRPWRNTFDCWLSQGCSKAGVEHGERGGSSAQGWVGGKAGNMNSGNNGGPPPGAVGGFGGGGGGSEDNGASGGGGGYSGGGSGTRPFQAGGGGGSYCGGSSCSGVSGGNSNDDGMCVSLMIEPEKPNLKISFLIHIDIISENLLIECHWVPAAESCKEIKMSEEEATSGKYWLSSIRPGIPLFAFCNMTTEDIDECTVSPPFCHVNAQCSNNIGSYNCTCNTGYIGNGKTCTDVDECTVSPPFCHVKAQCSNNLGSYKCTCNTGYIGNGKTCIGT
ncbi:PREDICTED: fibrillin-2-like [Acropora digitifera]|uniref:fibrillin-2-like n=1 Tax=Acropora digitifera TaxID=70779 RepID=UPI000779F195|nr:PREDICTED: fibrillin-2-like [Acropora digitifera]